MNKIITLSFDDGEDYDLEVIGFLKEYRLNATFYLCSSHIGMEGVLNNGRKFRKLGEDEIRKAYDGFEIGSHCENHQSLVGLTKPEIMNCIKKDIDKLQKFTDKKIRCLAYPGGAVDENVIGLLDELSVVSYARSIPDGSRNFLSPANRYNCIPTAHIFDCDVHQTIDRFDFDKSDDLKILHIYGHSYEIAGKTDCGRKKLAELFEHLRKVKNAVYLTNAEAYDMCMI